MFLWLGQASAPDLIQNLFNLPSLAHMQGHMVRITLALFHLVNMLLVGFVTSVVRCKIVLWIQSFFWDMKGLFSKVDLQEDLLAN